MLWKKESDDPDAMYVDLLGEKANFPSFVCEMPTKNDVQATFCRKAGNELFGRNNWLAAMKGYNDCLRFADPKSTNKSFGYANRSACFYHMELYNESLADIELAKATGYPQNLMPKLDRRRDDCMKHIEEGAQRDEFGLKLSFDPNEKFPCMADVLHFERDSDGSYSLFAKEDIDVGQTIVREKAFSAQAYKVFNQKCFICLKMNCSLMPCEDCTEVMFCSEECRSRHHHECGIIFMDDNQMNGLLMHELRLTMQVIRMFSSTSMMMKFVEEAINSDPNELPESLTDEKSRYRAFLKLPKRDESMDDSQNIVALIYTKILNHPNYASKFKTEKHRRFLMHLISFNFSISRQNFGELIHHKILNDFELFDCHTELMKRYFKNSCAPNLDCAAFDGHLVYYTIRPVKKDEQLFISLINKLTDSKEKRDQELLRYNETACQCTRCKGIEATPQERHALKMDPDYSKILNNDLPPRYNKATLMAMIDNCAKFLQKYGHIKWCDEIAFVVDKYVKFQWLRILGPSKSMKFE